MNANIDISNVVLSSERLTLRAFNQNDLMDFYQYASVDGVGQMAGWSPHKSVEESLDILNKFIEGKNTFALSYQGKTIGSLGIEKYKEEKYSDFSSLQAREIGYVLSKDYWGQGLMSEAVKIVTDYLFDIVDLDVIFVGHFVNNKRSERVIEKACFQFLKNDIYQTAFGSIEQTKEYVKYNPKHTYLDYQRVK